MKEVLKITSPDNEQYKIWKSLTEAKGIKTHKMFMLMGEKLVNEFINEYNAGSMLKFKPEFLIFNQDTSLSIKIKKTILSTTLFKDLDILGTNSPLLVLAFDDFEEKNLNTLPQGMEIICPLGDPRNLGSLTRSALGFGAREIILTKESAHPYLPHAVKASAGAILKMNFCKADSIYQLSVTGENYALNLEGKSLIDVKWPQNLRLWVGEEGPGLKLSAEQAKKMKFVNIPTNNIESLNAMVSTSLALWEWSRQNLKN